MFEMVKCMDNASFFRFRLVAELGAMSKRVLPIIGKRAGARIKPRGKQLR